MSTTRELVRFPDGTPFTFRDADGKLKYAYREVNDVQPGGTRDDGNDD